LVQWLYYSLHEYQSSRLGSPCQLFLHSVSQCRNSSHMTGRFIRPVSVASRVERSGMKELPAERSSAGGSAMERNGNGRNWRSQATSPAAVCGFEA
jgi:hypothetical protein